QGVFSIFFYTKKMLVKFTNIKKYRALKSSLSVTHTPVRTGVFLIPLEGVDTRCPLKGDF
ncbi:hypothetical protein, partial [Enterococcus faecium]|uniref:hypothetical protein n=1 Tax=Enterococcus faecium TaxID=1352 RepID=UPI001A8EF7EF